MFSRLRRVMLGVAAVLYLFPALAAAQPEVAAAVRDAVNQRSRALVIVGVRIPVFDPEGVLSPQAVAAQRQSIRRAVDDVLNAANSGVRVGHRYQSLPYFSAAIDGRGLAALASLRDVVSIDEDIPVPPALAQSVPLLDAPTSWASGFNGAGWTVAVLDTGVQTSHPMLSGRTVSEACYSNAGGRAGATSLCPGGAPSSIAPGSGVNCTGVSGCDHGTHVAGISVGSGSLNGVAPGAVLMATQVFTRVDDVTTCAGTTPCLLSYTSDRIAALQRVLAMAGPENANRIASVNMSLGSGRYFSNCDSASSAIAAEKAAIDNLRSIGVATVIASGNSGYSDSMGAPACISTAVSVGSTTKADTISSFSNTVSFLHLVAPGSSITSSVINSTTGVKSGTSMATPHVAGAWAILKQGAPSATVDQVLTALRTTGTFITDPINGLAFPRINVNAARLALAAGSTSGVPGRAGRPTVTSSGPIVISWLPPTTGGTPTHYRIRAGTTSGGAQLGTFDLGNTTTIGPVALPDGRYFIAITAANAAGIGPESEEREFTVGVGPSPPTPPTTVSASVAGNTVTLNWSGATNVSFYNVTVGTTFGGNQIGAFNVGLFTSVAGNLPAGAYYFFVTSVNPFGQTSSGVASFTVAGPAPPGVPILNQPTVSGSTVTISWMPGSGGAPEGYDIEATIQATGQTVLVPVGPKTSLTIEGVPAGNFIVRIRARNSLGVTAFSAPRLIVVGVVLIFGNLQATLTWNSTADIDLHVREPNGSHVYWANPIGSTARLDVDDRDGFGPENLHVTNAAPGTYQFYIVNYDGPPTTATIQIRLRPDTPTEQSVLITRTVSGGNIDLGYNVAEVNPLDGTIMETIGTRLAEGSAAEAVLKVPEK